MKICRLIFLLSFFLIASKTIFLYSKDLKPILFVLSDLTGDLSVRPSAYNTFSITSDDMKPAKGLKITNFNNIIQKFKYEPGEYNTWSCYYKFSSASNIWSLLSVFHEKVIIENNTLIILPYKATYKIEWIEKKQAIGVHYLFLKINEKDLQKIIMKIRKDVFVKKYKKVLYLDEDITNMVFPDK